jgi:hypothetical protein
VGLNAYVVTDPEETGSFQVGDYQGVSLAFDNTLRWQGLDNVLDGHGAPVSFAVESQSGTNWAEAALSPVPLPASLWVLSGALGALGWTRRRQDKRIPIRTARA